jgi:hypothetical protein
MQDFGSIAGSFAGGLPGSLPGSAEAGLPGGALAGGSGFGMDRLLMAERLGLVMARRAAEILDRHRESLAPDARQIGRDGASTGDGDGDRFALDDAIFTAVLDATNECLTPFDSRPPADRWCDALLHLLDLARYAEEG